jgi:hypothetical protein
MTKHVNTYRVNKDLHARYVRRHLLVLGLNLSYRGGRASQHILRTTILSNVLPWLVSHPNETSTRSRGAIVGAYPNLGSIEQAFNIAPWSGKPGKPGIVRKFTDEQLFNVLSKRVPRSAEQLAIALDCSIDTVRQLLKSLVLAGRVRQGATRHPKGRGHSTKLWVRA